MERIAVRLIITGRVQGVGYRWWARGEARRLGIDGWVRNRLDRSVELVAAGAPEAVERLIQACRLGPPAAEVDGVERLAAEDEGLRGFEERRTA
jgi:acylphosphatase